MLEEDSDWNNPEEEGPRGEEDDLDDLVDVEDKYDGPPDYINLPSNSIVFRTAKFL